MVTFQARDRWCYLQGQGSDLWLLRESAVLTFVRCCRRGQPLGQLNHVIPGRPRVDTHTRIAPHLLTVDWIEAAFRADLQGRVSTRL